jgi:hypothetical protein
MIYQLNIHFIMIISAHKTKLFHLCNNVFNGIDNT